MLFNGDKNFVNMLPCIDADVDFLLKHSWKTQQSKAVVLQYLHKSSNQLPAVSRKLRSV